MHEKMKDVTKKIGVTRLGRNSLFWAKCRGGRHRRSLPSRPKLNSSVVVRLTSAMRESLWSMWRVDMHLALRTCEEREVEVDASGASFSFMNQGWRFLAKLRSLGMGRR